MGTAKSPLKTVWSSLLGAIVMAGIGVLDASTGELRLSILYVVVIISMTWVNGRGNGMLFAMASALCIILANSIEDIASATDPHFLVSAGSDLLVFGFCVVGTNSLREVLSLERERRRNLARYLPSAFVDRLANEGLDAQVSRHYAATVVFIDIRGFTSFSQELTPHEVFELLQSYRRIISTAVSKHGGFVDKFVGDGALAVFGITEQSEDGPAHAVSAGLEMLSQLDNWNSTRAVAGQPRLRIGIGIHSGDVIAGAIGDEKRLEFTVLGDTVNLAARIEDLTRDLRLPLLVSEAVYKSLPPALQEAHDWAHLCVPNVPGLSAPVSLAYPGDRLASG